MDAKCGSVEVREDSRWVGKERLVETEEGCSEVGSYEGCC